MKIILDGDVMLYLSIARKDPITFEQAIQNWKDRKERFMEAVFTDECIICLSTTGENFRKINYDRYKEDRKGGETPQWLFELKDWAFANDPDVIGSPNGEADDYIIINRRVHKASVTGTVDKDMKTYPGPYYNLRTQDLINITEDEAYNWMFQQFIMGDSGDCIDGIYGLGPVKSNKFLAQYDTYEDRWYAIKELWQEKKGADEWYDAFNYCVNGTFIRRFEEDLRVLDFADMPWEEFKEKACIGKD